LSAVFNQLLKEIRITTNSKRLIVELADLFTWVKYGWSANIHNAAEKGNFEKVNFILTKKPQLVNAQDNMNETPLHKAANNSHEEVVKLLFAKGADVYAKSNKGHSPLHRAAGGTKEVVKILLVGGAEVNAESYKGCSCSNRNHHI